MMKIRCAICGVEASWERWFEPATNTHVIRAMCHGAVDESRLAIRDLAGLSAEEVEQIDGGEVEGVAFARKALAYG